MPRQIYWVWMQSRYNSGGGSSGSYMRATSESSVCSTPVFSSNAFRTRAIPGPPMLINDFQGVPSLPEPIDDDFITSQGIFPQPPNRTSVIAGFVSVCRMFRILSECFFHHRCILSNLHTISTEWTLTAEDRLHQVLREMPEAIQDPMINVTGALRQVFAMQRANILITAAIAKFALVCQLLLRLYAADDNAV